MAYADGGGISLRVVPLRPRGVELISFWPEHEWRLFPRLRTECQSATHGPRAVSVGRGESAPPASRRSPRACRNVPPVRLLAFASRQAPRGLGTLCSSFSSMAWIDLQSFRVELCFEISARSESLTRGQQMHVQDSRSPEKSIGNHAEPRFINALEGHRFKGP